MMQKQIHWSKNTQKNIFTEKVQVDMAGGNGDAVSIWQEISMYNLC